MISSEQDPWSTKPVASKPGENPLMDVFYQHYGAEESEIVRKISTLEDEIHALLQKSGKKQEDIASLYQKVLEEQIESEMILKGQARLEKEAGQKRLFEIRRHMEELKNDLEEQIGYQTNP